MVVKYNVGGIIGDLEFKPPGTMQIWKLVFWMCKFCTSEPPQKAGAE
jgi:hypothetical protein